jgi:hypothetical protein
MTHTEFTSGAEGAIPLGRDILAELTFLFADASASADAGTVRPPR